LRGVPGPTPSASSPPSPSPPAARNRWAVVYWVGVVLLYAGLGAYHQPLFLLGFWESVPFLFVATWLAGRLFPRPVPPLPTAPPE
jgi:hypothetical protein